MQKLARAEKIGSGFKSAAYSFGSVVLVRASGFSRASREALEGLKKGRREIARE